MIILRVVKGGTSYTSVKQKFVQANCDRRQNLPKFIFLVKKLLCSCTVGFYNKRASQSSSSRRTEELCSQQLSLVGD